MNNQRPSGVRAPGYRVRVAILVALTLVFAALGASTARARSWSYHYRPRSPEPSPAASATVASISQPTPAPGEQLSTARLLKRAIVSDLAIFVQEQTGPSPKASLQHSQYVVRHLELFDPLDSPEALGLFASLSGYYLGAAGNQVYDCLSLRKGRPLEPYFAQYLSKGNTECAVQLGDTFLKPSDVLGGHSLCPSDAQQKARLAMLISEIGSGKTCPDSDLAAIARSAKNSASSAQ